MKGPVGERDVSNIYMADYDGANQTRLTATRSLDIAPAWSPDGDSLAYTSYRSGYPDIILQSIRSLRPPTYPAKGSLENQNFLPAWSPDGTKLAFMSNRDGNPEIYVVNRDGSNLRRVTNHPSADVTPTWSPTGTQLAFTSDRSGRPQVYIVNLDGTGLDRISGESYCDRATWSPAPLNEIAYASQAGGGYEIRIFSFGTRESRAITDGIGSNESPAFAPNGRHIAFMSDRTGRRRSTRSRATEPTCGRSRRAGRQSVSELVAVGHGFRGSRGSRVHEVHGRRTRVSSEDKHADWTSRDVGGHPDTGGHFRRVRQIEAAGRAAISAAAR